MKKCYAYRRIIFETASALHAGSGELDPVQDMPIQLDCNGLPMINATSITGVLRHLYRGNTDDLFGSNLGGGSRIFVENAIVLDENGRAMEGIICADQISPYLLRLKQLQQRDHCSLSHLGSARKTGKFDRTVLIAGVRFICEFSIFAETKEQAKQEADAISALWNTPEFRLGGGSRNGFGKIRICSIRGKEYDLDVAEERHAFLNRSASFTIVPDEPELQIPMQAVSNITSWQCTLTPETFWMVSSGTGNKDIDIWPKYETVVDWKSGQPEFIEYPLLPATSIKGALAHRTAYYYNKYKGIFADQIELSEFEKLNPAVGALFGYAKNGDDSTGSIGRVIISDIYAENWQSQYMNHVKIDRFTGGALDGALFTEQVFHGGDLHLEIVLLPSVTPDEDPDIIKAFTRAVEDIFDGYLPLGGGTMRGLGVMQVRKGVQEA